MAIDGWKYYNHAFIPTTPPDKAPNLNALSNKSIWREEKRALLARYTTNWDCKQKTNWWYVIKDSPFDISALKSKRRYEINKGNKHFSVNEINPADYCEDIFLTTISAYETYPLSYRPNIKYDHFIRDVKKWNYYKTYGAFSKDDGKLYGYAILDKENQYIDFLVLKSNPQKEKFGINAAIINKILLDHEELLSHGGYICDGSRSIQHETAFQDYLEKYFLFRKAYCELNIVYRPFFRIIVNALFPFRSYFEKHDNLVFLKSVSALLKMEEIYRQNK